MILSDKAKSLRASMPTNLVDYLKDEVTYEAAVENLFEESLLENSSSFVEIIAEFAREYSRPESATLTYAAIIHDIVTREREAIIDDAINDECEYVASIIDDPDEMAAYRKLRGDLLKWWGE